MVLRVDFRVNFRVDFRVRPSPPPHPSGEAMHTNRHGARGPLLPAQGLPGPRRDPSCLLTIAAFNGSAILVVVGTASNFVQEPIIDRDAKPPLGMQKLPTPLGREPPTA